jgi:hypothetical protein
VSLVLAFVLLAASQCWCRTGAGLDLSELPSAAAKLALFCN